MKIFILFIFINVKETYLHTLTTSLSWAKRKSRSNWPCIDVSLLLCKSQVCATVLVVLAVQPIWVLHVSSGLVALSASADQVIRIGQAKVFPKDDVIHRHWNRISTAVATGKVIPAKNVPRHSLLNVSLGFAQDSLFDACDFESIELVENFNERIPIWNQDRWIGDRSIFRKHYDLLLFTVSDNKTDDGQFVSVLFESFSFHYISQSLVF